MHKIDTVCIIDDDPIFIFGTKRMMELSNFCNSFMIYNNGQEALNNLLSEHTEIPDIILLDINMPIMDGWQFLEEFTKTERGKKVSIYVVSSSIDPVDIKRVENYKNVSNYIIKPISRQRLHQLFKDIIEEKNTN